MPTRGERFEGPRDLGAEGLRGKGAGWAVLGGWLLLLSPPFFEQEVTEGTEIAWRVEIY